jgi:hypothetical protein
MGEWRELRLGDAASEVTVGHVGPMASEYVTQGIPVLRSQNVEPLRMKDSDLKFICGPSLDPHSLAYHVNSADAHHVGSHLVGAVQPTSSVRSTTRSSEPPYERDARVDPVLAKIAQADITSRALSSLRDTLLPKLISGELRVRDAERFVSAAV